MLLVEAGGRGGSAGRRGDGSGLPAVVRLGIAVLVLGFLLDVVGHAFGMEGAAMTAGHLVTLAGMGLALVGVLRLAMRRPVRGATDGRRSR